MTRIIAHIMLIIYMLCVVSLMGQDSQDHDSLKKVISSAMDDQEKLSSLQALAEAYLSEESIDSSLLYFDRAIELARRLKDIGSQASLYAQKGKVLFYFRGPDLSIQCYKRSFELFESINDSLGMADALNGIGVMYQKLGHDDSALSCYIQLATIAEKIRYEEVLGKCYVNMGILYTIKRDYELAEPYLDQSIPINEKYSESLVALSQMNKGLIFNGKGELDSAYHMYMLALKFYQDKPNSKTLADLYNNLGIHFNNTGRNDSANFYYTRAKDIYEYRGDWYTFCQVYHNMALIKNESGDHLQALVMLDSCLQISIEKGNIDLQSLAYRSKHNIYVDLGDYKRALENYWAYDNIHQVLFGIEKERIMAEMEMKYQHERSEAQIILLERDYLKKSKQSNIYLFTGIGIIAFITFLFLYFRQRAVKDKIIAKQRIRQLEEEKKLLAAKSLVEGQEEERKRIAREIHDGLGVLLSTTRMQFSTIGITSPEAIPIIEKASKLLEQASNDVRKISHNMMPGLLTKLGLYEAVEDLFEKIAETEGLEVQIEIPDEMERLPENREIMVYRILQELVNNTIKHAEAKTIDLRMENPDGQLIIYYSDDGKGFKVDEQQDSKSIGLSSIQSRVNFLNGKMDLQSEPGKGVRYSLWIPC